ncbi:hypothetical protein LTR66_013808 [Elasticomyces elasticus]|nr:hypothetical protein LTR66_013808 [Elasticomyces elasticus]
MSDMGSPTETGTPPKVKRALFNRPAWAQPQSTQPQATEDIFSRSGRSYTQIVAEQERLKRLKLQRKKEKEERRESSGKKRRRLSADVDDGDVDGYASVGHDGSEVGRRSRKIERSTSKEASPRRKLSSPEPLSLAKLYAESLTAANAKAAPVIELGDTSDEEEGEPSTPSKVQPTSLDTEQVDRVAETDPDEEFPELAARARERRRLRELEQASPKRDLERNGFGAYVAAGHTPRAPTPPPDPVVSILITSRIPNSEPLIVRRKLSQRLQEIRVFWCKRLNLSEELTNSVFLVYRMRKLYDVTTCKSLGIDVDPDGKIVMNDEKAAFGDEETDKVHVEAVTEEIFAEMKAEKRREKEGKKNAVTAGAADKHEKPEQTNAQSESKEGEKLIKILLKAKGYPDFKLQVRPSTTFARIAMAFLRKKNLAEDKTLFLEFDGDRLDPDAEVSSTDIDDMDCLDVHIK